MRAKYLQALYLDVIQNNNEGNLEQKVINMYKIKMFMKKLIILS